LTVRKKTFFGKRKELSKVRSSEGNSEKVSVT